MSGRVVEKTCCKNSMSPSLIGRNVIEEPISIKRLDVGHIPRCDACIGQCAANFRVDFRRNNDNKVGRKQRTLTIQMSMNFRF